MTDWQTPLYFQWNRRQIVARIKADPIAAWPLARRVFASTDCVYHGGTGFEGELTMPAEIMACLLRWPDRVAVEACLFAGLSDPHPLVVGYCLDGLATVASARLLALPPALLERNEVVDIQGGCLRMSFKLSDLARKKQQAYRLSVESRKDLHE